MTRETHKKSETHEKAEDSKQLTFDDPSKADGTKIEVQSEINAENQTEEHVPAPQEDNILEETSTKVKVSKKGSVTAKTHTRKKLKKLKAARDFIPAIPSIKLQKKWHKITSFAVGGLALAVLITSGVLSQYFKHKTLPNVYVAGVSSSAKNSEQLKEQLNKQKQQLKISFKSEDKVFSPKAEDIGFTVDVDKTIDQALEAKRNQGVFSKLAFWSKYDVPAVVSLNDTLLNQYVETNTPKLLKAPQDSQLQFDAKQGVFIITPQADGQAPNIKKIQQEIYNISQNLSSKTVEVGVAKKGPAITEAKLSPLLQPANEIVVRKVVLTGLGFTYQAKPAEIATWLTPTPQENGSVKLIVDASKVQSYVDSISRKISNIPVDRKVLKDETTGAEVVLQQGRDGTELADKQTLANAVTEALKAGKDTTQIMNITTAAYQTVNMNAYEKWIEVDISEQRTTAYERAALVKNFLIASGTKGHETVLGEFEIWHKNRVQTMQGGSKADGSYYSIPNVEWVSYFYKDYALHGAWWREKFGYPASHGCVNMTNLDAKWIFEWAPIGTKVIVHA